MNKSLPAKPARPPNEKRSLVEHDEDDGKPEDKEGATEKREPESERSAAKHVKRQKTAA